MHIKLYITSIWIFIVLISAILAKYQKLSIPNLKKRENLVFLILETLTLFVSIGLKEWTENQYEILCGSLLLLFGLIISYQSLLHKNFKTIKANKYLKNINSFLVGSPSPQNIYFSGDWLQLAGLALIWGSHYSISVFFVTYSIFVYSISTIETRNFNRKFKNQTDRLKNDTFRNFTKIMFRNAMAASFPLIIFITHAVIQRNITLFFGTFQDAVGLLTTLAQAETTVLALAITFLFVLVEFTNSAYSPRLVQSFTRQWPFKIMVFFACLSIVTKAVAF